MSGRLLKWIGVGLAAAGFAAWAGWFIYESSFVASDGRRYFCLFDDSMISMRYAWNLAHGEGLVWNPGERVEGFTNLLMTLYMALWCALLSKSGAVLAVQISGAVFLLAGAWLAMRIGEALLEGSELEGRPELSVLFFAGALLYYPLDYWSLMGMETGLLAALIAAGAWRSIRAGDSTRPRWGMAALLGLAFLTRPDSAVAIACVMLHRLAGVWRRPGWLKALALESALIAACVASVSIFRWIYYGSLTPNTYRLKLVGLTLGERIENGLGFIEPFVESIALPLAVALFTVVAGWRRHAVLVVGLVLVSIAYQVYVGGDPWVYWRQNAPFVPLLFALVSAETALLARRRMKGGQLERLAERRLAPSASNLACAIALGALLLGAERASDRYEEQYWFEEPAYTVKTNRANVNVSLALLDVTDEQATVGVTWAGTIPYYTGRPAVDFLGKSDPVIAALPPDDSGAVSFRGMKSVPGHNKYDLNYSIKERRPTFVQAYKWGRQNLHRWVRDHYTTVSHMGVGLRLLEGSPHVEWDRLHRRR